MTHINKIDEFAYQITIKDTYYVLQAYNKDMQPHSYLIELSRLDVKGDVVTGVTQEYEVEVYDATLDIVRAIIKNVLDILESGNLGSLVPLCLTVGGKVRGYKPVTAPVDVIKLN